MNALLARTITVVVLVPALFAIVLLAPWLHHLAINALAAVFSVVGAYEAANFFGVRGFPTTPWLIPILGAALPVTVYLEIVGFLASGAVLAAVVALAGVILLREVFVRDERDFAEILPRVAVSLAVLLYPGLFMTYFIRLSSLPDSSPLIIVFLLMVFANDTLAYVAGTLWGRTTNRVLPVSPNKSVVGFAGGILGTAIVASGAWLLAPEVFFHRLALAFSVGLAVAVAAIFGDLVESALKRSSELKDSGFLIPGRGGVLDSIDSILFAAPVCFYLMVGSAV